MQTGWRQPKIQSQTVSGLDVRSLGRAQGPALAHGLITPAFPTLPSDADYSVSETLTIEIKRDSTLPAEAMISAFDTETTEETPMYSGAALVQMVEKVYGRDVCQSDFRGIIDYLKENSHWEDADFQTWRLILKRALSSPANNVQEFKDLEAIGNSVMEKKRESISIPHLSKSRQI